MPTCRVCGNSRSNASYTAQEMLHGTRDEFDYFQCSACRCLQIDDIPDNIGEYYPDDYYAFDELDIETLAPWKRELRRLRTQYDLEGEGLIGKLLYEVSGQPDLPDYLRRADIAVDDRVLDVGCGIGELLVTLRRQGFSDLYGIDPYLDEEIEYPNDVSVSDVRLSAVDGEYDLILFNHSFEHMPRPARTLNRVHELLTEQGLALIRIPTSSSFAWEHYGVDWFQLDAPRHLFLHSETSMGVVARQASLTVREVHYDSHEKQFWASEQYRRGIDYFSERSHAVNPDESIFSGEDIALFGRKADELNQTGRGDQATFYLQKC